MCELFQQCEWLSILFHFSISRKAIKKLTAKYSQTNLTYHAKRIGFLSFPKIVSKRKKKKSEKNYEPLQRIKLNCWL